MDLDKVIEFVLSRQNEDGGFTICKPLPSNLSDTFYAVRILKILNAEIPKEEKLLEFLRNNNSKDLHSLYFVLNSLNDLGVKVPDYSDYLIRIQNFAERDDSGFFRADRGITATYSFESPNELRELYMAINCLRVIGREFEVQKDFLERYRKGKGFGKKFANLQDTFYCVYVLQSLDKKTREFILEFRCEGGGFSKIPGSYPPYLEDTFYALSCFAVCDEYFKDFETAEFVENLQNYNGGFRRVFTEEFQLLRTRVMQFQFLSF
ncbi:MAG: prenyltransferase/squalene oxidase repeat-containing protein [Archaeoglobaceae archaeon]